MKLLWTRSSLPLSVFIRWGLNEPVSHFAVEFSSSSDSERGIIYQSNLLGTGLKTSTSFRRHCEVVYEIEISMSEEEENRVWDSIVEKTDDSGYDFLGFIYFTYVGAKHRILGSPFPETNPWGDAKSFLCTEIASALPLDVFPGLAQVKDFGIMSPERLFEILSSPNSISQVYSVKVSKN